MNAISVATRRGRTCSVSLQISTTMPEQRAKLTSSSVARTRDKGHSARACRVKFRLRCGTGLAAPSTIDCCSRVSADLLERSDINPQPAATRTLAHGLSPTLMLAISRGNADNCASQLLPHLRARSPRPHLGQCLRQNIMPKHDGPRQSRAARCKTSTAPRRSNGCAAHRTIKIFKDSSQAIRLFFLLRKYGIHQAKCQTHLVAAR